MAIWITVSVVCPSRGKLLFADVLLSGKFLEILGSEKDLCRRAINRANAEHATRILMKVATAPTVAADASDGNPMAALIKAVKREDEKVSIDVGSKLEAMHFIHACCLSRRVDFCCAGLIVGRDSGDMPTRARPHQQAGWA
jgi:hypothetical protein